ncbi:MAG: hypothetical protein PHI85_03255 [Victivallaceae bacterium]|nr:hypothetical protein [Victivallaceae bacterium]
MINFSMKARRWTVRLSAAMLILLLALASAVFFTARSSAVSGEVRVVEPLRFKSGTAVLGGGVAASAVIAVPWGQSLTGAVAELDKAAGVFELGAVSIRHEWLHWGYSLYKVGVTLVPYRTGTVAPGKMVFDYDRERATFELDPSAAALAFPDIEVKPLEVDRQSGLPLAGELRGETVKPNYVKWGLIAFLAASALALGWVIYRHLRSKTAEWLAPPTAWEAALRELGELRGESHSGYPAVCFARLSDILRRYIERRFSLPSTTTTTPEFMVELRRTALPLTAAQRSGLAAFLETADMVKFAKREPDETTLDGAISQAEQFVRETVPPKDGEGADV